MLVGHVPIELSMLLSRFLKASEKNAVEVNVCGKRRREVGLVIPGHYKARTKSRSHCKILDRELNYMKTKYSHFEIEHELPEERILMPYVTSSKWTESAAVTDLPELLTLFDMGGGHDGPPKMFLTTVPKRSEEGSWNLVTFNINLWDIKKNKFLGP